MATQQENPDKGLLMIGAVAGVSFFWCFLPFSSERSDPDTPSPYGDWPLAPLLPQFAGPHNAGKGGCGCPRPRRRLIVFNRLKEADMLDALKKLIGADEEGKKRRQQALEEEEREREERVRAYAKKLKHDAEQIRQAEQDDQ